MPDPSSLAWTDVKGGMNAADPPQSIATNQVARMVNCRLEQGLPTTRYGTRVVPLSGDGVESFRPGNNQGSIFFNPAKGQGGVVLAESIAGLLVACEGRKWRAIIQGRKAAATARLEELTGGHVTSRQLHLVWWLGAEDIALANDAQSNCWIWDKERGSRFSSGYQTDTFRRDQSSVPNAASVMAYTASRIVAVVNARYILASDNLHRTDSSSSKNLLDWIEQTYWATGQYFLPPTSVGNILAAVNMATPGESNNGYAALWFHLEDGLFSLNLNVYPRSEWATTPMVKTALEVPGAAGPYAVCTVNGDQYFLTRDGLMSLKWAINTNTSENPLTYLSEEVGCWLHRDYKPWARFRSIVHWKAQRRLLCTTAPVVQGRWRWHRGIVSRNELVTPTAKSHEPAWEGLWVLHPEAAGIVQLVGGIFGEEERQFAWTRGQDGQNRLVEFCPWLREDVKEDGTSIPIPCQVITRAMDGGKWWEQRGYTFGRLFFRNIVGKIRWGVWVRAAESPKWVFWQGGTAENPRTDASHITGTTPLPLMIPLGKMPSLQCSASRDAESRFVQCLIRWQGSCTLEAIRLTYGATDTTQDTVRDSLLNYTFQQTSETSYDDYEYSDYETPAWVSSLK